MPSIALRRDTMLPHEKNIVPRTAQPTPRSAAGSNEIARSCQKRRTSPATPSPPAATVRGLMRSPKKTRALIALKIDASEKITATRPEEIVAVAV
ncbi:hypothetical protein [Salibaculum halophilum]|uniref:hypothetical protein n=1 Tax=Salibaculum halophilum TaxID=1914408 RepID=UPI001FE6D916|nr:hypothetical protein [Salibaculum halophilum]